MNIEVTAFQWVPHFARGVVRDLRVRWALEEAGLAYRQRLIGREDQNTDAAYVQRCQARPGFQKAFADQMASFAPDPPAVPQEG